MANTPPTITDNPQPIPTFTTARLRLRPVVATDVEAMQRHFADYEVIRWLSRVPWPYPADGAERFVLDVLLPNQGRGSWFWAITERGVSDELIGLVELVRHGRPENRGFWLARPFWGRGYMGEALEPITEYAFNQLGFEKLLFDNAVGNHRSRRIKQRTPARKIGEFPRQFVDPALTSAELWEITKEEWANFVTARQREDGPA